METRTIHPYSSFIEDSQGTNKENNSNSNSEDESIFEEPSLDKIEQAYELNTNIIDICNSLLVTASL